MSLASEISVHAEQLSFSFNKVNPNEVLRNLSLKIKHGERVAVMGASGSGKTTLLKILAGLKGFRPNSGLCSLSGRFAMVFQQPTLLNHMNVMDNITLPVRLQGLQKDIAPIVSILDLEHLLERYPYQLSGGQQRRVALARAMMYPEVKGLLMDEPFTGLDEPLRERILIEIEFGLKATNLTCILSTHSPYEAAFLADRVLFLGDTPSRIVSELVISLPRGDRGALLDKTEFFDEVTKIRKKLNAVSKSLDS